MSERLYQPRNAEAAFAHAETLGRAPEKLLSAEVRQRVFEFEDKLFNISPELIDNTPHQLPDELFDQPSIERIVTTLAGVRYAYPEFYLTPGGKEHASNLGLTGLSEAQNIDKVKQQLLNLNGTSFKDEVTDPSRSFAEETLRQSILGGDEIADIPQITLVKNPGKLAYKLRNLLAYKDYLRCVKQQVNQESGRHLGHEQEAKLELLKLYQKMVNGHLAELYVDTVSFLKSAENRTIPRQLHEDLHEYGGRLEKLYRYAQEHQLQEIARRLDALKHGRHYSSEGGFSPLIPGLERSIGRRPSIESPAKNGGLFTDQEIEKLSAQEMTAVDLQELFSKVLGEWDLLSSQSPEAYDEDREGRAEDDKWQVVIKYVPALSVNGTKGVINVPRGLKRKVVKPEAPYGAVPVAGHELEHVIQSENARRSQGLHFGRDIRGRGFVSLREAGAIRRERQVLSKIFGISRGSSKAYLKAVEALHRGATLSGVARALYETLLNENPNADHQELATWAANRTLRLFSGGGYNTRVLDYVEQVAIGEAVGRLPDEKQRFIFSEAGMNLGDAATLHSFGLLPNDENQFAPPRSYEEIAAQWLRDQYLRDASEA